MTHIETIRDLVNTEKHGERYQPVAPVAWLVASRLGQGVPALCGDLRHADIVKARHIAMWLARELGHGWSHIARYMRRDHTTVIHAHRKICRQRGLDADLRALTDDLLAQAREGGWTRPEAPPAAEPGSGKPASDDPGEIGAAFYDLPRKNDRRYLEEQNERFAAAMAELGEVRSQLWLQDRRAGR